MAIITDEYVTSLPDIYREILRDFWMFNPLRRSNWGVAIPTMFSVLADKYTLGEIREACDAMVRAGVLEIRNESFVYPTTIGDDLIRVINSDRKPLVPAFPELPSK